MSVSLFCLITRITLAPSLLSAFSLHAGGEDAGRGGDAVRGVLGASVGAQRVGSIRGLGSLPLRLPQASEAGSLPHVVPQLLPQPLRLRLHVRSLSRQLSTSPLLLLSLPVAQAHRVRHCSLLPVKIDCGQLPLRGKDTLRPQALRHQTADDGRRGGRQGVFGCGQPQCQCHQHRGQTLTRERRME